MIEVFFLLAQAADTPDFAKEARFHQYYLDYNQQETSQELWKKASDEKAQSYQIQKGDTLWGLSQTLFGDPNYWPKIWSLNNSTLENPHEVLPLQLIMFTPGTAGEAPQVTMVDGVPQEKKKEAVEKKVEMEPLAELPASLPDWQFRKDKKSQIEFEPSEFRRTFPAPDVYLSYYVQDGKISSLGHVVSTEMGMNSAAEFQYITVRLGNTAGQRRFLVIKELPVITNPDNKKSQAHVVEVQGEIELIEAVNVDERLYRAIVKKVIHPIEVGAQFIAGQMSTVTYKSETEGEGLKSRIIGGQFGENRRIFALDSIVYLNSGVNQGVRIGSKYDIYRNPSSRSDRTLEKENPRRIGKLKIITASENYSTGVVTDTVEEIRVGDATDPSLLK